VRLFRSLTLQWSSDQTSVQRRTNPSDFPALKVGAGRNVEVPNIGNDVKVLRMAYS
jgi:hypothetical protein